MRTRTLMLLVAVLLAVPGSMAALADDDNGNGNDNGNDKNGVTELTLYAIETNFVYLTPEGPLTEEEEATTPPEAGHRFVIVEEVYYDEERTESAGRNDIECVFTEAITGETEQDPFEIHLLCHGVLWLDGKGSIAWQASVAFTEEFDPDGPFATVAITGGTGDFMAAGGQVEIFDTSTSEEETTGRYEVTLLDLAKH